MEDPIVQIQRRLAEDPNDADARMKLAEQLKARGRNAEAVRIYLGAAKLFVRQRNARQAVLSMMAVLELEPKHTECRRVLRRLCETNVEAARTFREARGLASRAGSRLMSQPRMGSRAAYTREATGPVVTRPVVTRSSTLSGTTPPSDSSLASVEPEPASAPALKKRHGASNEQSTVSVKLNDLVTHLDKSGEITENERQALLEGTGDQAQPPSSPPPSSPSKYGVRHDALTMKIPALDRREAEAAKKKIVAEHMDSPRSGSRSAFKRRDSSIQRSRTGEQQRVTGASSNIGGEEHAEAQRRGMLDRKPTARISADALRSFTSASAPPPPVILPASPDGETMAPRSRDLLSEGASSEPSVRGRGGLRSRVPSSALRSSRASVLPSGASASRREPIERAGSGTGRSVPREALRTASGSRDNALERMRAARKKDVHTQKTMHFVSASDLAPSQANLKPTQPEPQSGSVEAEAPAPPRDRDRKWLKHDAKTITVQVEDLGEDVLDVVQSGGRRRQEASVSASRVGGGTVRGLRRQLNQAMPDRANPRQSLYGKRPEPVSNDVIRRSEAALSGEHKKPEVISPAGMAITVEQVPKVPLFAGLTPERLHQLLGNTSLHRVPLRHPIMDKSHEPTRIFLVLDGQVDLVLARFGLERRLDVLTSGALVGSSELLGGKVEDRVCRARQPTTLLELGARTLTALGRQDPSIWNLIWESHYDALLKQVLATSRLFQMLNLEERMSLSAMFSRVYGRAGDVVVRQGDMATGLYLLIHGELLVHRSQGAGEMRVRVGEFFDAGATARGMGSYERVIATENSTVLFLSRRALGEVYERHPEVLMAMRRHGVREG